MKESIGARNSRFIVLVAIRLMHLQEELQNERPVCPKNLGQKAINPAHSARGFPIIRLVLAYK